MKKGGVFLLFVWLALAASARAVTLDDCAGVQWGSSLASAKSTLLSQRGVTFDDQRTGLFGSITLHGGDLFNRPVKRWYLLFLDDNFCQALVDFELDRDLPPLTQCRRLRQELSAMYGRVSRNYEMPMTRDPSWQESRLRKPSFQCDWDLSAQRPTPSPATLRIFLCGDTIDKATIRVVMNNNTLHQERMRRLSAARSGVKSTNTVSAVQPAKPRVQTPLIAPIPASPPAVEPPKVVPPVAASPNVPPPVVAAVASTASPAASTIARPPAKPNLPVAVARPAPPPVKPAEPEKPVPIGTLVLFWFLAFACVGMLGWVAWLLGAVLMKRD